MNIIANDKKVFAIVNGNTLWTDTHFLKVSSLQGFVSHLTEVHVTIVMTLFPLKDTHKTIREC